MTGDTPSNTAGRLARVTREVSTQRLRTDIERNAQFGALDGDEGRGRTNRTGTDANRRARAYLVDRLEETGLDVFVDPVGNIVGRWVPDEASAEASPVATGSHLDSVPEGGIFDGPLGVYAALESVRVLRSSNLPIARPIEIVSFTEEEGHRFSEGLLGSSVAAGSRPIAEALEMEDDRGISLGTALEDIGFRGTSRLDASEWDAWLELHIEQGKRLENAGASVGIVDAIAGIVRCTVEITGSADHAGSTPMDDRSDALAAASEVVLAVEDIAQSPVDQVSTATSGTVGDLSVSPGAINVVPGSARLRIDIRDVDLDSMAWFLGEIRGDLNRIEDERGVQAELDVTSKIPPTGMSQRCRGAFRNAVDALDTPAMTLHSGAGHDTMLIADVTDAGLLFAPSRDGISHSPEEWTDWPDCTHATRVLASALGSLAMEQAND